MFESYFWKEKRSNIEKKKNEAKNESNSRTSAEISQERARIKRERNRKKNIQYIKIKIDVLDFVLALLFRSTFGVSAASYAAPVTSNGWVAASG